MVSISKPVSVSVSYWINGVTDEVAPQQYRTFSPEQGTQPARLGLPEGQLPAKPEAGFFGYSGMHDQGPLIPPREGGEMAQLIGCVQAAKQFNDEYLTRILEDREQAKEAK
jgi:hypothetical protein